MFTIQSSRTSGIKIKGVPPIFLYFLQSLLYFNNKLHKKKPASFVGWQEPNKNIIFIMFYTYLNEMYKCDMNHTGDWYWKSSAHPILLCAQEIVATNAQPIQLLHRGMGFFDFKCTPNPSQCTGIGFFGFKCIPNLFFAQGIIWCKHF